MQRLWSNGPQSIDDILFKFTYAQTMFLTANSTKTTRWESQDREFLFYFILQLFYLPGLKHENMFEKPHTHTKPKFKLSLPLLD